MSVPQMRPTFVLDGDDQPELIMKRVRTSVLRQNEAFQGQFTDRHAMISINPAKRHFWSPWLHLEIRQPEGQKILFGRFSPHPSIWTGFMFTYLAITVLIFFALMLGISQQLADESAWAYYCIPFGMGIMIALWFAAQAGQKLAQEEMRALKAMVEACAEGSS